MYQPPDPAPFNETVWEIVRQIPEGIVSTYGQIASMIPAPPGVPPDQYERLRARWVGNAMRQVPAGSDVPWHRVINSQGTISIPRGSASADVQRARLEMEGVEFDDAGRVDFDRFGWDGPSADWLAAHGLLPPRSLKSRPPHDDATQLNLF
ncbi:MAG TPA: MGMT family protein [Aggregatilineales bacterium]|nr:MGMT family protein [Aggregatilineales bacterium]